MPETGDAVNFIQLRQLRMLVSISEHGLNVSQAAADLGQAQSALSKQIQRLEAELGQRIFIRRGKRLTRMTPFGQDLLREARKMLSLEAGIRKRASEHSRDVLRGDLLIGTTHLQARHVLPPIIRRFSRVYPNVFLHIYQAHPRVILEMLLNNRVDLGLCTELLGEESQELCVEQAYRWNRCVVLPRDHPLAAKRGKVTLEDLATTKLLTYVPGFTGRGAFDRAFGDAGLVPNVVLSASDSDVIKTYVRLGLGVGVIARKAYDPGADADLASRDVGHLFPDMRALLARRRDKYMSDGISKFVEIYKEEIGDIALRA